MIRRCVSFLITGVLAAAGSIVISAQSSAIAEGQARSSSWRQITAPGLIVSGNAPSADLKRTLQELARFRAAFAQLIPSATLGSPVPTQVVVLRDQQAFERFQPRDASGNRRSNVGGYFTRRPDSNFIVFGTSNEAVARLTIFHEYTHYITSRNVRTAVPMWLNEGLAEFYSTFRGDYRGQTLIGAPPGHRVRLLRESTYVPLREIVSPRDIAETWRWPTRISMFYAESWALVHYIVVERKNPVAKPLGTYITSLARTGDHDAAFKEAFGTDVEGMDRELRDYVRRVSFKALTFDVQADAHETGTELAMLESDVDALEGRLLLEVGATGDAERELTGIVRQHPEHAAAQTALARLRLEQGREDEGIAALQKVVSAEPDNGAAHYYLASALNQAWRHEEASAAFSRAIKLMPGNPAPWLGLNGTALALKRDAQAKVALQNALQLEWSPSYYWTQAFHALRLGRNDVASDSLATFVSLRGTGEDFSVYPMFVHAIAAWRAGRPSEADAALALAEKGDTSEEWTLTVLRFLQGRLDHDEFLRKAGSVGEQTEARTYLGFKLSIAGRADEALSHFRWVAERGAKNYLEYGLVKNELNRLKYQPKASATN